MFASKLLLCSALLMLNGAVLSQTLIGLPGFKTPETTSEHPSTNSTTASTSTTTTSTTTEKPITTSSTSTIPPTTPTTSTEPPKTTTTPAPAPTTTHAPQPFPAPSVGTWNASCIMLQMAAQLNFTYEDKNGNLTHGLYNIPSNATVEDKECDRPTIQNVHLIWGPNTSKQSLLMYFDKKNDTTVLSSIQIHLTLLAEDFPDAKENQTLQLIHRSDGEFKTPEKMSYHCTRVQKLNLTETIDAKELIGWISVSQVQVEAFRATNATGFSTVHDCDSSETSDVVPIAVGIALAALILVVLISYLCARRRSTSRGYMSF
ncbi:lysosome-associated membrane glycoprotein 1 [Drosophila subpulchrella]|uniref:lysosome-associated membrane glycoprotein 1 n=1 Tax=Drosophila subpulchrella TaxID=1486046 RepID=UPI0018A19A1B|nr:lysosome-associated membrane glycoprotein 1 [Drosophila subpulchrella]